MDIADFSTKLKDFQKVYKNEENLLPFHFNVIDELHANENAHSRAKDDQKLMYKVWQKLAEQDRIYPFVHYCWRNKTVLIFPIPLTETNDDYAKELCEILKKIKEEITRDHSYLFAEGENNN